MKFENEKFWIDFNNDVSCLRWDKASELSKFLKDNHATLSQEEKKILIWEKNAFNLQPSSEKGLRFGPMVTFNNVDGSTSSYPDISSDFTSESFEYYLSRSKTTKNSLLKARYLDILISLQKRYDLADDAVNAYLLTTEIYFDNKWDAELADALERALEISCNIKQKEQIEIVVRKISEVLHALIQNGRPRYTIELIECILKFYKFCSETVDWHEVISVIDAASEFYKINDNSDLQREFLKEKINILKKQNKTEEIITIQREIFKTHLQDAETIESQPMISKKSYEKALESLELIGGSQEEKEELNIKIEALSARVPESFKKIEASVEIPREEIDEVRQQFLKVQPR